MLKKIYSIISTLLVIIVVLCAVLLVGVRVIGYKPFAILSPSMSPKINTGDLVYAKAKDFEKIKKGDVITFVIDEDLTTVTHRVDEINKENRSFYTKGDANKSRDGGEVLYENVVGVVDFSIPLLGYLSIFISKPTGKFICIAVAAIIILIAFIPDIIVAFKKTENK